MILLGRPRLSSDSADRTFFLLLVDADRAVQKLKVVATLFTARLSSIHLFDKLEDEWDSFLSPNRFRERVLFNSNALISSTSNGSISYSVREAKSKKRMRGKNVSD